eukprot:gnl/MRDRNA2_/MRDRNA2_107984_c0_seq1.p1 gnl/MRDRNA2_/MRDRNA2_107984_c0~~gnl/MRDRNA2_/MRDRNA2_107984_c0_seq1.p1  ORF type:complete len:303 (-),score=70.58 gnl/MRDRNA2_/MRDRNA2_107984_c0_seq1:59-967(-)
MGHLIDATYGLVLLNVLMLCAAESSAEEGCTITARECTNFPQFAETQFRDVHGETHLGANKKEANCLKRAEDFHHWCGNDAKKASVAATFHPKKSTQVYHEQACDRGWSLFTAFCYKHFWTMATWFEAEKSCREHDSNLVSIHSEAENQFVFQLTGGLTAWIGYTDLDKDTHYQWSDSTQDDFTNWAKNCTGREHEPDCQPEKKQQQWYDWDGQDAGTYVCKKSAKFPMALLVNSTTEAMFAFDWNKVAPSVANAPLDDNDENMTVLETPQLKNIDVPEPDLAGKDADGMDIKLAMPLGSVI